MAFSIKNEEADRLARRLSAITGESLTEAVILSLRERLDRHEPKRKRYKFGTELKKLGARLAKFPVLDPRPADDILGYDVNGLPR